VAFLTRPDGPDDGLYAYDLASIFALDVVERSEDRSVFSGRVRAPIAAWPVLYGGQIAAQCLVAAGLTVTDDRAPHSLHGYFLRAGKTDRRVEFVVDHDRDGRGYSARHVSALQDGRVIFSMLTSFSTNFDRTAFVDESPYRPERIRPREECVTSLADPLVDALEITTTRMVGERRLGSDMLWMRVPDPIEDTPLMRAAALTYVSDLGSGFSQNEDMSYGIGDASLDHAMWFHRFVDPHEWLILDMWPISAVDGRGVYHGAIRDESGQLAATIVQENLLRPL
jgi:acyl-CoA thioesterase II